MPKWKHIIGRKHFLLLSSIVIVLCAIIPFRTQLLVTMQRTGILPSYTERVYSLGDTTATPMRYVPLGDSLTAGVGATNYHTAYPYLLAQRLLEERGGSIHLQPHAIPGATTEDALTLLLDKTIAAKPDMVTILLGVNDVHKEVDPETFARNYDMILHRLREETGATLYVIGIPHIGIDALYSPEELASLRTRTEMFNRILLELTDSHRVQFVELYKPNNTYATEEGHYASDRFHPSSQGYERWTDTLYDALR